MTFKSLLTSWLVIHIIGLIVNLFVYIWESRQRKYTKDIYNFTIRLGKGPLGALYVGAIFCALIAVLASQASVENGYYTWIGMAFLSVMCVIGILAAKTTVKVDGDRIIVKKYMPPGRKTYSFSDITSYRGLGKGATVYSGSKKLFAYDTDMLGAWNMTKRLQQEGIPHGAPVKDKEIAEPVLKTETMKKEWAWKRNDSLKGISIIFLILTPVFGTIFIGQYGFIGGMLISLVLMLPCYLICLPFLIGPSVSAISKVERGLGINFDDEMARLGVTNFNYVDKDWYMTQVISYVSVVRRDYIARIERIGINSSKRCKEIIVRATDGTQLKIYDHEPNKFLDWLREDSRTFGVWEEYMVRTNSASESDTDARIREQMRENGYTEEQIKAAMSGRNIR